MVPSLCLPTPHTKNVFQVLQVISSCLHILPLQSVLQWHDFNNEKAYKDKAKQMPPCSPTQFQKHLHLFPLNTLTLAHYASFSSHCFYICCSLCLGSSSSYSFHQLHIKLYSVMFCYRFIKMRAECLLCLQLYLQYITQSLTYGCYSKKILNKYVNK